MIVFITALCSALRLVSLPVGGLAECAPGNSAEALPLDSSIGTYGLELRRTHFGQRFEVWQGLAWVLESGRFRAGVVV